MARNYDFTISKCLLSSKPDLNGDVLLDCGYESALACKVDDEAEPYGKHDQQDFVVQPSLSQTHWVGRNPVET